LTMPPAYEILLLNTAVPQIQAAQSGDTYVVPRDIAFSAALTLSAGTANGVPYLNGSKVLTTGSALTFDGTNFATTGDINSEGSEKYINFRSTYSIGSNVRARIRAVGAGGGSGYGGDFRVDTRAPDNSWNTDAFVIDSSGQPIWTFGGSEQMRLTSTGLGIGTSSPANKLHVTVSAASTAVAAFYNTDTADGNGVYIKAGGSNSGKYALAIDNAASSSLLFLDSSGNLGLGVTPSAWGSALKAFENQGGAVTATSAGNLRLYQNSYQNSAGQQIYRSSLAASLYAQDAGQHIWFTAPSGTAGNAITFTQAMTLDASGNLLVGQTSDTATGLTGIGITGTNRIITAYTSAGAAAGTLFHARRDSDGNAVQFVYGNWSSFVGSISVTSSATAYNTSSDYRLKDNPQPLTNSGAFIDALKPKTWNWKADGSKGVGFLAHEVQEVSPKSVVGTKDAVDADGKPVMQAMEYGSAEFIANIVAELQSLRARVAQLEQGA
jgi:hypothetical protein